MRGSISSLFRAPRVSGNNSIRQHRRLLTNGRGVPGAVAPVAADQPFIKPAEGIPYVDERLFSEFFAAHRPIIFDWEIRRAKDIEQLMSNREYFKRSNDEYHKLFNNVCRLEDPNAPPNQLGMGSVAGPPLTAERKAEVKKIMQAIEKDDSLFGLFTSSAQTRGVMTNDARESIMDDERELFSDDAFAFDETEIEWLTDGTATQTTTATATALTETRGRMKRRIYAPTSSENKDVAKYAINILKRRRKKMKKHKWKKQRKEVRESTRYNREKTKRSGPQREKQE
ncbi:hypothetical protein HDU85_004895 [Gaertneriomyces sp. JEL0708]|nr:hypothetical protein HDU85_004895 [Gaertneriomyces sp. JEL0708]